MTPELAHLYALRSMLDAIILGRERDEGLTPPKVEGCQHPEALQKDATTVGGTRRVLCLACNTERDA